MLKSMLFGGAVEIRSWVATLGGSGNDYGNSVTVAPDGSVYVCGSTASVGAGNQDLLLAKFNSSGTVQWQKTLGGSGNDRGYSVTVAPDGSVYVCGYADSTGAGSQDLLLAKFSSSGTVQWQKILGGRSGDYGNSAAVAPDGSVYVCGYTFSVGAGNQDLLLAKFNSSGTVQWQKTLGGSGNDYGNSVTVAPDGSVYVCGSTASVGAGNQDLLLAKFNSSGTVQWQKILGGSNVEFGYTVAVAPDGSVYVCGYTSSVGAGNYDLLLAKFNSSGTVQWQKTLGGSGNDYGNSVTVAPDGSVYVCGSTASVGAGNTDLLLAKITDSLIGEYMATLGVFTFQDVSLTLKSESLTSSNHDLSVSNAGLTVNTPSLTVGTPSLTTNLFTL